MNINQGEILNSNPEDVKGSTDERLPLTKKSISKKNIFFIIIFLFFFLLVIWAIYYKINKRDVLPHLPEITFQQQIINSSIVSMRDIRTYTSFGSVSVDFTVSGNQNFRTLDSEMNLNVENRINTSDENNPKSQNHTRLEVEMKNVDESEKYLIDFDSILFGEKLAYYKVNDLDLGYTGIFTEEQISFLKNKWYSLKPDLLSEIRAGMLDEMSSRGVSSFGGGTSIMQEYNMNKVIDIFDKYEILKFKEDLGDETIKNVELYHYKARLDGPALFSMYFDMINETLGSARARAMDMEKILKISSLMPDLILYYYDNNDSYEGFVLPKDSGLKSENIRTSKNAFVIWSETSSTTDKFCYDSDLNNGYTLEEIDDFACPDSMSRTPIGEKKEIDLSDIKKEMKDGYRNAIDEGFQDVDIEIWIGKEDNHIYRILIEGNLDKLIDEIVIKSLNSALAKSKDVAVKADIYSIIPRLTRYYDDNNDSYEGFVLPKDSGLKSENIRTSKNAFVIWSETSSTTDKFCYDSDLNNGYTLEEIDDFACPDSMSRTPTGEKKNSTENDTSEIGFHFNLNIDMSFKDFNLPIEINKPENSEDLLKATERNLKSPELMPDRMHQDSDGDGLTDDMEFSYGTDINNPDTDGDGFSDGDEINGGYDPLLPGGAKLDAESFLRIYK